MKQWLPVALCAASLFWAIPAVAKDTPVPVIQAKDHPMHASVFASRLNKNAHWRGEVARKGYDVAFNEWMAQDHPYEYATYCTQQAKKISTAFENTDEYREFNALLPKREDLRAEVQSMGVDATFADWLREEHPAALKKKIDPFMNDKQMPRGMKM